MKLALASLAIAVLVAAGLPAQAQTLPPRDECSADPGFAEFRARLLDVLARRDSAALLAIAADDIQFSFGDDPGRDAFARSWGLADPLASGVWSALSEVLLLGCARDGESFAAPFLFLRWPEQLDIYAGAVAPPGTLLYRSASPEADFSTLAWHVISELEDQPSGWRRARLTDGRTGYIEPHTQLLSPIGFRAVFERVDGRWRMTAFIAGD